MKGSGFWSVTVLDALDIEDQWMLGCSAVFRSLLHAQPL